MLQQDLEAASQFQPVDRAAWRALVDQDLKGAPFERKLVSHTYEGLYLQPLYTADDWPSAGDPSGFSGVRPLTRGAVPLGNAPHGWAICQERFEADPAAARAAILEDLAGGVDAILLRLDACARGGFDPDDPRGASLAGLDGTMAYSARDLDQVLEGVHLGMIGVELEAGAAFLPAAALLAATWDARGVSRAQARGAFNADPLAVLARDGSLPYSLEEGLRRMAALARWTSGRYSGVRAVRVGTAAYHHGGATATQDLAFAMATGLAYLRAMTEAGLSVDEAANQIRFSFALGCSIFLATAKLRAARRLWGRVVEACGGSPEAAPMRMHVRTSKRVLSTRDPWVNLLRNTACVFAAGIAGADSIGSTPFDAILGEPSSLGRRVARNTHHVLMEECHLHRVNDPAGGSWYIERLTDELAAKAWVILQAIESRGGMAAALTSGWIAGQVDSAFAPRRANLATRKDPLLGVSDFPNLEESRPSPPLVDRLALRRQAAERIAQQRTAAARAGAAPDELLEAARRGATIGQLATALGADGAPAHLVAPIAVHPFAEPFERLRDASDRLLAECGSRPAVFLASIGRPAEHLARTTFARNLFEAGGFEVAGGEGWPDPSAAIEAFRSSGAHIAVVCSSDPQWPTVVPAIAPALHRAGARAVVLAGNPGEREAEFRAAGIDRFVFIRCDVVRVLSDLLASEGVTS